MRGSFQSDGFCIVPAVLDSGKVSNLIAVLENAMVARSKRGSSVFGARNLLDTPEIRDVARDTNIAALVSDILGDGALTVRGIFFDKTPGANWPVAWHQDLTLAVAERRELSGWINWSNKAGVHHVQPPSHILERMVTLRLQLDDCGADNGPLRVLPGSHCFGRLDHQKISELRAAIAEEICCCDSGSVLMMRPLLLHASSAAMVPNHRRVLHLEFAARDLLPPELCWTKGALI